MEKVRSIQNSASSTISNSALIRRIQHLLSHKNQWLIRYIFREYNHITDALTKMTFEQKEEMQILIVPTREIEEILEIDRIKMCYFRSFPSNSLFVLVSFFIKKY